MLILPIGLFVGFLIGSVGVGGVLLIPALVKFSDVTIHIAAATSLFSFLFTGVLGTILFQRKGSLRWDITVPICAAGFVFSFFGAQLSAALDARVLTTAIAILVLSAGALTFSDLTKLSTSRAGKESRTTMLAVGAACGLLSGLSGAGGPLFLVPGMLVLGVPPLVAIGVGQVLQTVSAVSASYSNFSHGLIDLSLAALAVPPLLLGAGFGVYAAHAVPAKLLKNFVGLLCVAVGGWMLFNTIF